MSRAGEFHDDRCINDFAKEYANIYHPLLSFNLFC